MRKSFPTTLLLHMSFFLFCTTSTVYSQEGIKWRLKPLTFDVDRIMEKDIDPDSDLYVFEVNKLQGIVDINGKVIANAKYKSADIESGSQYYALIETDMQFFYDKAGTQYTYDQYIKARPKGENKFVKSIKDNKLPFTCNIFGPTEKYEIVSTNGKIRDTIVNTYIQTYKFNDEVIRMGDKVYFISTGKILNEKDVALQKVKSNYFVGGKKGAYNLYDFNLKPLLETTKKEITLHDKTGYLSMVELGSEVKTIYDPQLNKVMEGKFGFIYEFDHVLAFDTDSKVMSYDTKAKAKITHEFDKINHINHTFYTRFTKDSLKGIFDLGTNKVLIQPEFRTIFVDGAFIFGNANKDKMRNVKGVNKIFNRKGEFLREEDLINLQTLNNLVILKLKNGKTLTIDDSGKVWSQDDMSHLHYAFMSVNDKITPWENLVGVNDKNLYFQSISAGFKIKKGDKEKVIFIAKKNDQYGIIDVSGKTLVPFVFDIIQDPSSSRNHYIVKYKNKYGIIDVGDL
jgi:hypothetical protein